MSIAQLHDALTRMGGGDPTVAESGFDARMVFGLATAPGQLPAGVRAEPASAGGVPGIRVSIPDAVPGRLLIHLHGGGYISGTAAGFAGMASLFGVSARSDVFVLDYRLAGAAPFPAAVDDTLAAYVALESEYGGDKLAIVGDSAGGGLAVTLLTQLRSLGIRPPAAAALLSPWVDLALTGDSISTNEGRDLLLTRDIVTFFAESYLAGADPREPFASPLFASLEGIPPVTIHAAADEILVDDARRLAVAIRDAGSSAELEVWDGMVHDWGLFWFAGVDESMELARRAGAFLGAHLGGA